MRTETVTHTYFSFSELPENVQDDILERMYDINVDWDGWYELVFDDAKKIGKILGIDIDNIYFSGFSSQGDGACFEGTYEYARGSAKKIREYAPKDETLHRIADELQEIQRKHFYALSARIKHSGHYYHEYCTDITVYDDRDGGLAWAIVNDEITDCLRSFMGWIYRNLEKEYEYQTSEEAIRDTILANEYEFTEDGQLA